MATEQGKQNGEEKEENLWSEILNDVATSSARNRPQLTKTLIVLGDINSGKSTLVDKLCQISKTKPLGSRYALSGCGLEYRFIDVQDEETDDLLDRMGVWILDGVVWHSSLLPFALNKNSIVHTSVMIAVDMSQPWTIMESLERWGDVLRKHIDSLKIPPKSFMEMKEQLVKQFQGYVDPEEKTDPVVTSIGEENIALPLGETTLTSNLGVPIIVVCTKSDSVVELEKTNGYRDEHFDFIQHRIREFCLNYGAALFYTSTKDDKNIPILHKYLLHRAYGMPFKESAWVIDRDTIFIPSGWDTAKKLAILHESMKSFSADDEYERIIIAPKPSQPEPSVTGVEAEDEQVFLVKLQALMAKSPRSGTSNPTTPQSTSTSKLSYSPSSQQGTESDKADGETVLANFFNSLLTSKKPLKGSASSSSRVTSRNEASAEVDKLMKKS